MNAVNNNAHVHAELNLSTKTTSSLVGDRVLCRKAGGMLLIIRYMGLEGGLGDSI